MKKIVAVICEYNPFHLGHLRQLEAIRRQNPDCAVLSLMSGSFVQRGECAILPKYLRAEAAIRSGADLVLELPYPWCCGSAEYFASGAVSLLAALGVDALCFGSESGDAASLTETARRLESDSFRDALATARLRQNTAESDLLLRRRIYRERYGEELPIGANDTLGLEYLLAMRRVGWSAETMILHRSGPESATASREAFRHGDWERLRAMTPEPALSLYRGHAPTPLYAPGNELLALLRLCDPDVLALADGCGGGVSARLIRCAMEASDPADFYARCATKRFTNARLRRAALHGALQTTTEMLREAPLYTLLLAANRIGCDALKRLRKAAVPILTRPAHGRELSASAAVQLTRSRRADSLAMCAFGLSPADELRRSPFLLL